MPPRSRAAGARHDPMLGCRCFWLVFSLHPLFAESRCSRCRLEVIANAFFGRGRRRPFLPMATVASCVVRTSSPAFGLHSRVHTCLREAHCGHWSSTRTCCERYRTFACLLTRRRLSWDVALPFTSRTDHDEIGAGSCIQLR